MPQPGRLLRGASTSPACVGWGAALQEPHHSHFEACQARGTVIASQIPPPTSESARSPAGTRHGGSHFLLPPAVTEQRSDREQPRGRKSPRGETATSSPIRQVPAEHLLAAEITPKGGAPPVLGLVARGRAPGGDGGTPRPCPAPRSRSPRCCPTHSPANPSNKPREGGCLLGFIQLETPPEMGAARWARGAAGAPLRGSALGQTPQPSGSKIQQETSWHTGISLSKPHFFGEEHRQPLHHLFWPPQEQAPIPRCSPQSPLRTAPRPQRARSPLCF